MRLCGDCGIEYRCCKTGLRIHDTNFHPDSRHAADMFFCESCKATFINRNDNEYFCADEPVHLTITNDPEQPTLWDPVFVAKMQSQYGLELVR